MSLGDAFSQHREKNIKAKQEKVKTAKGDEKVALENDIKNLNERHKKHLDSVAEKLKTATGEEKKNIEKQVAELIKYAVVANTDTTTSTSTAAPAPAANNGNMGNKGEAQQQQQQQQQKSEDKMSNNDKSLALVSENYNVLNTEHYNYLAMQEEKYQAAVAKSEAAAGEVNKAKKDLADAKEMRDKPNTEDKLRTQKDAVTNAKKPYIDAVSKLKLAKDELEQSKEVAKELTVGKITLETLKNSFNEDAKNKNNIELEANNLTLNSAPDSKDKNKLLQVITDISTLSYSNKQH